MRLDPRHPRITHRKLALLVVMVLLVAGLALPTLAPAAGVAKAPAKAGATALEATGAALGGTPFYDPEAMELAAPGSGAAAEKLAKALPSSLLPDEMKPALTRATGGDEGSPDVSGGGTGGWTNIARAYDPLPGPNVRYDTWGGDSTIDNSGRLFYLFTVDNYVDVSQAPDPPGTHFEWTASAYYSIYQEGAWSAPTAITSVTGVEDTSPIAWYLDQDGNLHFAYRKWAWARNTATGVYMHSNENIWYRYRSPEGVWSTPVKLSDFTGMYSAPNGFANLIGGRMYVVWYEVLDKQTGPASYTGRVCVVDGTLGDWNPLAIIRQWDYTDAAGQVLPAYTTMFDASPLTHELMATYSLRTVGAAPGDDSTDCYAVTRSAAGTWGTTVKLSSSAVNEQWIAVLPRYDALDGNCQLLIFVIKGTWNDPARQPTINGYLRTHTAAGWTAYDCFTDAPAGETTQAFGISADLFDQWHIPFTREKVAWDGGAGHWVGTGSALYYTETAAGQFGAPQVVEPYQADRFIDLNGGAQIDNDGFAHLGYVKYKDVGGVLSEYQAFYADNVSAGAGAGFIPPVKISADSLNKIDRVALAVGPDGTSLVSWVERRMNGVQPVAGEINSRRRSASGSWSAIKKITAVPGSTDIMHVVDNSWAAYYQIINGLGEQLCVFETAKYDAGTATYLDFKKYSVATTGGEWGDPELISAGGISGKPSVLIDNNQRAFALFDGTDTATDQAVTYASMQPGATPASTTYYFAEGTTREGFDEWISIQNPGEAAANVEITYMLGTGETRTQNLTVPKTSRATVKVNDAVGPGQDVSARVRSDQWIVAERPMYFDYRGWQGGHDAMGALNTSRMWYFAEGNTQGAFSEYLTLQNPSEAAANVIITYMLGDGSTVDQALTVGPHSRATVEPRGAVGDDKDVSMRVVSSGAAIVAERPMYFDYQGWAAGGSNVMGGLFPANRWYFAEGTTREGFDTFICLQNPGSFGGMATVTYILGDGTTSTQEVAMAPTSRRTVKVDDAVGPEKDVAVVIDATIPVLAERPMYFDYHGFAPGGHVSMGAPFPMNAWFLAEGTTLEGFEEWLSLENPGDTDATATVSFILGDGSTVQKVASVPKKTRVTLKVNDLVGPGQDVSTFVWGDQGIIVERPMYFVYGSGWAGGTDVLGFPPGFAPNRGLILFLAD